MFEILRRTRLRDAALDSPLPRESRRDRRHRREIDNPNTMWGEDDARWDNGCTVTTSDDYGTTTISDDE
jgi:hypothetical protein